MIWILRNGKTLQKDTPAFAQPLFLPIDTSPLFKAAVALENAGTDGLHELDNFEETTAPLLEHGLKRNWAEKEDSDLSDLTELEKEDMSLPAAEPTSPIPGKHWRRNANKRLRKQHAPIPGPVDSLELINHTALQPFHQNKYNCKKNSRHQARIEARGHIPSSHTLRKTVSLAQTIHIPDFDMEGNLRGPILLGLISRGQTLPMPTV